MAPTSQAARPLERLAFRGGKLAPGFYLPSDHFVPLAAESVPENVPSQLTGRFTWGERSFRLLVSWMVRRAPLSHSPL